MQNTDEDDGNDGSAQINLQVNFFNIKNAHKKAEEKKVSIPTWNIFSSIHRVNDNWEEV